jgi:hypothetical protein
LLIDALPDRCLLGRFKVRVMRLLDLEWSGVVQLEVEALAVPPPRVFKRRQLDWLDGVPRAALTHQLGLVSPSMAFASGVVAFADDPGRGGGAEFEVCSV